MINWKLSIIHIGLQGGLKFNIFNEFWLGFQSLSQYRTQAYKVNSVLVANNETIRVTIVKWNSNKCYVFWVCVCSLRCPACSAHAPCYIVICGLSGCTTSFPYYLINGTINAVNRVMQRMFHSRRVKVRRQFLVVTLISNCYRGADKSSAQPGRKQANISVGMAWISFGALPYRKKKLGDSSRLDVVEIARVRDMLPSVFPSWSG